MTNSWFLFRAFILLSFLAAAGLIWLPQSATSNNSSELVVRFLDVGQGDAVHIMTPDGFELLIDGGPSAAVLRELAVGRSFFDHSIDMVIATHPDTDHVAGLVDVLERYEVHLLLETAAESDSPAALAYGIVAELEGAQIVSAQAGQVFQLGASTTVRVLSPHGDTSTWRSNPSSVVVQVIYGDIEFMLTGDAPDSIENYLVKQYGETLESDVLKLGHHGSKTSTSELFLDTVQPEFAVVSAAVGNRYGHPHQEVMQRVFTRDIKSSHTGTDGTVIFKSDGKQVWIEQSD